MGLTFTNPFSATVCEPVGPPTPQTTPSRIPRRRVESPCTPPENRGASSSPFAPVDASPSVQRNLPPRKSSLSGHSSSTAKHLIRIQGMNNESDDDNESLETRPERLLNRLLASSKAQLRSQSDTLHQEHSPDTEAKSRNPTIGRPSSSNVASPESFVGPRHETTPLPPNPSSPVAHRRPTRDAPLPLNLLETPPRGQLAALNRPIGLPTPPRSPKTTSESAVHALVNDAESSPPSPMSLLSPPNSGRSKPHVRPCASPKIGNESNMGSSDEEVEGFNMIVSRARRARQTSASTTVNGVAQRPRQRTVSGQGGRLTPSRLRYRTLDPDAQLSVGYSVDGTVRELGVISITAFDGAKIVLRGPSGLSIESKVVHAAGETRCEIVLKSDDGSPPFRPVKRAGSAIGRALTPSKSPLMLPTAVIDTPRQQRQGSHDLFSPIPPTTPRREAQLEDAPHIERNAPALLATKIDALGLSAPSSSMRPRSPNRFSLAFEGAVSASPSAPSFPSIASPASLSSHELVLKQGGLAARRLGQRGALGMRLAVKSQWSDTDTHSESDSPLTSADISV